MADEFDDFLGDERPLRDRKGRPLLVPAGGGPRMPYTRASGLASWVMDDRHIAQWRTRSLAKAMAVSPDLCRLAASEPFDPAAWEKPEGHAASGRRLDDIAERALDRIGLQAKADYGTAVHTLTEPGAKGTALDDVRGEVDAFWAGTTGLEILGTEVFLACDDLRTAGTVDHVVGCPDGYARIGDKKTGAVSPLEWAIQLATYSWGKPYDVYTDERPGWISIVEDRPYALDRSEGLIFHLPANQKRLDIYSINLDLGMVMARHAAAVRDYHETPRHEVIAKLNPGHFARARRQVALRAIASVTSRNEMLRLAETPVYKAVWNNELREAARARLRELEA